MTARAARRPRRPGVQARTLARKAGSEVRRDGRRAVREARKGAGSPWLERSARLGYVIRGLLYGAMGVFGVGYSVGVWQQTTDQRGALYLIADRPEKILLLAFVVAGLVGYSAWGFIRAIFDPLHRGDDPTGIAARLGFVWSGISYAALLVFCLQFLLGSGSNGSNSLENSVLFLMRQPFGPFLTLVAGAVGTGAGLGQFVDAYKATFRRDLERQRMKKEERTLANALGRFGMFSRGVIFTMLGWFVVQAALHADPNRAHGMGYAFQAIARQPLGHLGLFVVASGFIALGLHSLACARWIRMLDS